MGTWEVPAAGLLTLPKCSQRHLSLKEVFGYPNTRPGSSNPTSRPCGSLSLSLACLHSPNTHRLLSWVLSHHTQTHSLPQCPCPQLATGPAPQSPLLPWANESQMAACDSAMACGNPDALPSHAPHPAPASPADRSNLLLWGWRPACLGLRIQTAVALNGKWLHSALAIPEGT